jgi:uncharacterized protein YjiS (DUF1127 family)
MEQALLAGVNGDAHRLARAFAWPARTLLAWGRARRDRRLLAAFDDHMLRDIGLYRAAVGAENAVGFWLPRPP